MRRHASPSKPRGTVARGVGEHVPLYGTPNRGNQRPSLRKYTSRTWSLLGQNYVPMRWVDTASLPQTWRRKATAPTLWSPAPWRGERGKSGVRCSTSSATSLKRDLVSSRRLRHQRFKNKHSKTKLGFKLSSIQVLHEGNKCTRYDNMD